MEEFQKIKELKASNEYNFIQDYYSNNEYNQGDEYNHVDEDINNYQKGIYNSHTSSNIIKIIVCAIAGLAVIVLNFNGSNNNILTLSNYNQETQTIEYNIDKDIENNESLYFMLYDDNDNVLQIINLNSLQGTIDVHEYLDNNNSLKVELYQNTNNVSELIDTKTIEIK